MKIPKRFKWTKNGIDVFVVFKQLIQLRDCCYPLHKLWVNTPGCFPIDIVIPRNYEDGWFNSSNTTKQIR